MICRKTSGIRGYKQYAFSLYPFLRVSDFLYLSSNVFIVNETHILLLNLLLPHYLGGDASGLEVSLSVKALDTVDKSC